MQLLNSWGKEEKSEILQRIIKKKKKKKFSEAKEVTENLKLCSASHKIDFKYNYSNKVKTDSYNYYKLKLFKCVVYLQTLLPPLFFKF